MKKCIQVVSLFVIIFSFSGCRLFKGKNAFTTYTIKKGSQSSRHRISFFTKKELKFSARFNQTAVYCTSDSVNQQDINKLYGFSDCSSGHHYNSARFGWRWYQGQLQIFAYTYAGGRRTFRYMTHVNLNEEYEYCIRIERTQYVFSVNGIRETLPRACSVGGIKYYLFPYFGGNEIAPRKIRIKIREKR